MKYSKELMKHFNNPKFVKDVENSNGVGEVGNVACGDIMHLEIKIKNNKIEDIGFKTFGCAAAIASSDVVCELAKGKTIEEAKKIKKEDIIKKLKAMPPIKVHCSVLGIEALRKAIENFRGKMDEIKSIVSDIGGVMVKGNNLKTHYIPLCNAMGVDKKRFFESYKKYVGDASRGKMTAQEMIYSIANELGVNKKKLLENWIKYKRKAIRKNVGLEKIFKKLKKKYKVVSMSGVLDLHYELCNEKKIYDVFDFNICSYKVKTNKPDIQIYKLLVKRLKTPPNLILFIDDTEECLSPAQKLGMKTILYKNNSQLLRDLKKRGVLVKKAD